MKGFLKKVVLWVLKRLAKRRLKKFRGKVFAVTGSVGKTTTKEAIFSVLNSQFKVTKSQKSMNSDFGLLLTILDIDSGYSSAAKWSWFLAKAFYNSFFRDHSEVLLLELGVDKPGDMDYLMSIVRPDVAIMTNIFPVHMADGQFKDLESVFEEKSKMVKKLKKGGIAVLNIDNPYLSRIAKERSKKDTITFGKDERAQFMASKIKQSIKGMSFDVDFANSVYKVETEVLGEQHVYSMLPAIICGHIMGIDPEVSLTALKGFALPPGRMSIIPGLNDITMLDGSYNSSPSSVRASLKTLDLVADDDSRRVAVLGSMNELGEKTKEYHEDIGGIVAKFADLLITVGKDSKIIAAKAKESGMDEWNVHSFNTPKDAAEFYKKKSKKDDIVLVKGSQNRVRLEKFVKALMLNPEDAKKLLVRQDNVWKLKL